MWGYIHEHTAYMATGGRIATIRTFSKSIYLLDTGHSLQGAMPPPKSPIGIPVVSLAKTGSDANHMALVSLTPKTALAVVVEASVFAPSTSMPPASLTNPHDSASFFWNLLPNLGQSRDSLGQRGMHVVVGLLLVPARLTEKIIITYWQFVDMAELLPKSWNGRQALPQPSAKAGQDERWQLQTL